MLPEKIYAELQGMLAGIGKQSADASKIKYSVGTSKPGAGRIFDRVQQALNNRLGSLIEKREETFSERLLKHIDEKGFSDADVYKKAGISRQAFSRIRSNADYHPKLETVLVFAIVLQLNQAETDDLLKRAGYWLSQSEPFGIILHYFIAHEIYDLAVIDEALLAFHQQPLYSREGMSTGK